jgi:glycogen debranching enzyme
MTDSSLLPTLLEYDLGRTLMTKRGSLMALCGVDGDIERRRSAEHGVYFHDTRFLDHAVLLLNGRRPGPVCATDATGDRSVSELASSALTLDDGTALEPGLLRLRRERSLNGQVAEVVTVRSFAPRDVVVRLELEVGADFSTLFAVRGSPVGRRGVLHPPAWRDGRLELRYDGADGRRRATALSFRPEPDERRHGSAVWLLALRPGDEVAVRVTGELRDRGRGRLEAAPAAVALGRLREAAVESDNPHLERAFRRSLDDLALLVTREQGSTFLAAGVPWFMALFGRDSLVTAIQTLAFDPSIAEGTLELLAAHQGRSTDPWRDEEPGKILHELRVGEDANLGEIPHTPYYGTVDATPLFVALLAEHARWTGDLGPWRRLRPNVERALAWIAAADHDGDGLLDYVRRSERGLDNQGWKDSDDCLVNRDGTLAEPPIALVEVQGYAYRALRGAAWLCALDGEPDRARELEAGAADLRRRFDAAYWLPRRRYLALAVQAGGRPVEAIASNAGHALWSGIVEPSREPAVAERLLSPDLFSGWGVRTLARGEAGYDPTGYHVGSVWPHDTSLVMAGLARAGFRAGAARLLSGLVEAASGLPGYRLPEVFGGQPRGGRPAPAPYPAACAPQAWAAGALPFMLAEALGLDPDGTRSLLVVRRPVLPAAVTRLTVRGVRVAGATVDLAFVREGARVHVDVVHQTGPLTVRVES